MLDFRFIETCWLCIFRDLSVSILFFAYVTGMYRIAFFPMIFGAFGLFLTALKCIGLHFFRMIFVAFSGIDIYRNAFFSADFRCVWLVLYGTEMYRIASFA